MKQVLRRTDVRVAALLGISLTSMGCTDEETGLYIIGNTKVEAPECVASADADNVLIPRGVLDVAITNEYVASWLVASQLTPRGDKTNLRTETMIATLTGSEVRLTGGEDTEEYTVPAAGSISPESSEAPGLGVAISTLIPASIGVRFGEELTDFTQRISRIATVKVFGKTLGGIDIETAPFTYEVIICEGCSVSFPAESIDANGNCGAGGDSAPEPPCAPGQDDSVDCRLCNSFNAYCQAPNGQVNVPMP